METIGSVSSEQGRVKFDMTLLDPTVLRQEDALACAIRTFEVHLNIPTSREGLLRELMEVHNCLGFVISVIDEPHLIALKEWLLHTFPPQPQDFVHSIASDMLLHLSRLFWSLSYPRPNLRDCHRAVDLAIPVLKAISTLNFRSEQVEEEQALDDLDFEFIVKNKSQRQKKKAKRNNRIPWIDPKPFDNLDVDVPVSKQSAQDLADDILGDQKRILEHYLDTLRTPELRELLLEAYIPTEAIGEDNDTIDNGTDISVNLSVQHENEAPAAYPMVQPIKAALYFETADGFGEWRILISTRADRNLREFRNKNPTLFRIVIKKIKELSKGHFSDDNQKRLTGSDNEIPIFEAKMTSDSRLVYQIDCVKEFDTEVEWQVIRVFGIYTHAQLERRFWEAVGHQLADRGKEYRKRCLFRNPPHHPGDNVFLPASFPPSQEITTQTSTLTIPNLRNEDREELHALLVLEKFVTFSQALLNSILADQDVAHVFQMSPQEQEIVKHASSCYVLGRSGTGKTTTMLFKMLGIERTWDTLQDTLQDTLPRPRQLFVTQSRVLAEKVEEYYRKLSQSHAAAQRTAEESDQLAAAKQANQDQGLVDRDEEEFWRGDLPKSYGELKDEHFPLFLTFDHLCRLLEADLSRFSAKIKGVVESPTVETEGLSNDYMQQNRESFVSYGAFLRAYWPHFPQNLTKNLDPSLIFAEFMGVIKGSEPTLHSSDGFLDKNEYIGLSHRSQGTFATQRDAVYSLFQSYLKQKAMRRDYDAADRTHTILRGLREIGVPGHQVDFIYIDEAQDNLLIDAFILRSICRNPNGMFWAGDTAQTISVGSSFRFNDLKAFLYRLEMASNANTDAKETPKTFQLTINYRSHGGIVGCAHSVVKLITEFWPHAIDILAEERGIIDGLKPVFFSGWDQDTVRYEQFLFGASGSQIEFGAQQCERIGCNMRIPLKYEKGILVRDDVARDKLREQVGEIGLILTLYESKGLEFNDVLLYNFFEDSTVDLSQWRVILNALPSDKRSTCPRFDEIRHSGVCRELKFLYVAITRARKNLWIADCSEKGEPMRAIWDANAQIQNCTPGDDVPRLAMSSTTEEWAKTARTLFDNRRYMQAVHCYERAGMPREKHIAFSYYLREQARSLPVHRRIVNPIRMAAFLRAADSFHEAAEKATKTSERHAYYRIAAEGFAEVGDNRRAAEEYLSAAEYAHSAQHYRKAALFDEAVAVAQSHKKEIPVAVAESIITVARIHYFRENYLEKATKLFDTLDECLEFMEDYDFDVARVELLEQSEKFTDAAELHLSEGHIIKAIELFLRDEENPESSRRRAEQCLLEGLWRQLSFRITPKTSDATLLGDLLKMSTRFIKNEYQSSSHVLDQIRMFQCIMESDLSALQTLGKRFYDVHNDAASTLLCLDHAFSRPFKILEAPCAEVASVLEIFLIYARELQKVMSEHNPFHKEFIQQLFYLQVSEDDMVVVKEKTFLYQATCQFPGLKVEGQTVTRHIQDLLTPFQQALKFHLLGRVTTENSACMFARAFWPCTAFAALGKCNRAANCQRGHIDSSKLDNEWYHSWLRIHFQQILIYQTIAPFETPSIVEKNQMFWLGGLYQALFPPHRWLGSIVHLKFKLIPEADKGIQVVRDWVRNLIYTFDLERASPDKKLTFLGDFLNLATLAYTFDQVAAREYMRRASCVSVSRPTDLLRGKEDQYIVFDLILALDGIDRASIVAGVLFLQHICEKHISMDINPLCNMIEYLTTLFIVFHRFSKSPSLHNVTLPRTWLLRTAHLEPTTNKDTRLIPLLIQPMKHLLREVYFGCDWLGFEDRNLRTTGYQIRNIFAGRICRALCLLGYNIQDLKIREDILKAITSLYSPDLKFSSAILQYVNARNWMGLVKALRSHSNRATSFDELIELKEEAKITAPLRDIKGVRTIVYKTLTDIGPLLDGTYHAHTLNPEAEPFVPRLLAQGQAAGNEEEEADGGSGGDEGIDHTIDIETAALSIDAGRLEEPSVPVTEEELAAAEVFLVAYRRLLSRREAASLPDARTRWYTRCLEITQKFKMRLKYRVMFLGPLPHALVCLEKANTDVYSMKKKANRRLKVTEHEQLEEATEQFNHASRAFKEVLRLQKILTPPSEFHRKQNTEELRQHIVAVEQLISNLPGGVALQLDQDLKIAVKGIVSKKRVENKPKPELFVEDDLLYV